MKNVQKTIPPRLSTPISLACQAELKIIAVKRRIPLQQLVQEILDDWLAKNRKRQAA